MIRASRRASMRFHHLACVASLLVASACSGDTVSSPAPLVATGPSRAFGLWTPGPNDSCTKEQHDAYSVVGPDGKLYPTWHPPVDATTGCSFGHEHGRDPRGSDLYLIVGDMPLGVANEALETWDPANPRRLWVAVRYVTAAGGYATPTGAPVLVRRRPTGRRG